MKSRESFAPVNGYYYSECIRWVYFVKAKDGYFVLYFPEYEEFVISGMSMKPVIPPDPEAIELMVIDRHDETITGIIQSLTENCLKVISSPLGESLGEQWKLPADIPDASDFTISHGLRSSKLSLPRLTISACVNIEGDIIKSIRPGRIRAIAPLIHLPDGSFERQFNWLFADFWFGELSRDVVHIPHAARFLSADFQTLQWLIALGLPPQEFVDGGPDKAVAALKNLVYEFEKLLDKPDVDEVRDIQQFLADRRHWILLSPNAKHVWSQKMLGNKYKVDFVVRESDDSYCIIRL